MTRECHVRFCESAEVRSLRATHLICHCHSEREALKLRQVLDQRFAECGLVLHPEKTKVVYCKDTNRKGDHAIIQFDFLGYTFRPRLAKWRGDLFGVSFLPAASPKALKAIRQAIRGWSLQTRSDKELDDLARMFNPYIRGWINYYSHFYKSALHPTLLRIDAFLLKWARRKFKRFRYAPRRARNWLARVIRTSPDRFAHWTLLRGGGRAPGAV
jgi:RNA-directed DNA polymerase